MPIREVSKNVLFEKSKKANREVYKLLFNKSHLSNQIKQRKYQTNRMDTEDISELNKDQVG